jgi:hypothetical protein
MATKKKVKRKGTKKQAHAAMEAAAMGGLVNSLYKEQRSGWHPGVR